MQQDGWSIEEMLLDLPQQFARHNITSQVVKI